MHICLTQPHCVSPLLRSQWSLLRKQSQYHACWCTDDFRSNRHYKDFITFAYHHLTWGTVSLPCDNRSCHPGAQIWNYYLGTLSSSQVTVIHWRLGIRRFHLRVSDLQMSYRNSVTGYQDRSPMMKVNQQEQSGTTTYAHGALHQRMPRFDKWDTREKMFIH